MHHPRKPLRLRFLLLAALTTTPLLAQSITRGPYLQQGTPTSVVVRWRTDIPVESVVKFGTDAANLEKSSVTKWKTTEHVVILEGLTPSTKYHYSVGTTDKVLDATGAHFTTSPKP